MRAVQVTRLSITPIKGFAMQDVPVVELDRSGARGDRDLFVVDADDKLISVTRTGAFLGTTARLEKEQLVLACGDRRVAGEVRLGAPVAADFYGHHVLTGRVVLGRFSELLSDLAGEPVRLVRADDPGAASDIHPVTLVGTASLEAVEEHVDPRRFRMLVEVATDEPFAEDDWAGAHLEGDDVKLAVGGRVPRCAAITRNPDGGDRDRPLVRALRDLRGRHDTEVGPAGVCLGVYATVVAPGRLRRDEELRLVPEALVARP